MQRYSVHHMGQPRENVAQSDPGGCATRQEPVRSQGGLRQFLSSPSILGTYYFRSGVPVQHWTSFKQIGWRLIGVTFIHHDYQRCSRVNIPALPHWGTIYAGPSTGIFVSVAPLAVRACYHAAPGKSRIVTVRRLAVGGRNNGCGTAPLAQRAG
jgi:hypothetical protein